MTMQAESLEVLEKASVAPAQARAIVRAIEIEIAGAKDTLATKQDISELRAATKQDISELRATTKQDLSELRTAAKQDIFELRSEDANSLRSCARR